MSEKLTLTEIAKRIDRHLSRFERTPALNPPDPTYGTQLYCAAGAYRGGRYVMVQYDAYQGQTALLRNRAEAYLAWLDAGNVGTHWKMQQEKGGRV
jgi:hypothetical protein